MSWKSEGFVSRTTLDVNAGQDGSSFASTFLRADQAIALLRKSDFLNGSLVNLTYGPVAPPVQNTAPVDGSAALRTAGPEEAATPAQQY